LESDDEGSDEEGSDDEGLVDPANGGALWYHSWEIQLEDGRFVYRELGLPYDDANPPPTFARRVRFPALNMRAVEVQVCAVRTCTEVCGLKRFHSSSEEEDGAEEGDGGENENGVEEQNGGDDNDPDA
jgi:hypothetical protein